MFTPVDPSQNAFLAAAASYTSIREEERKKTNDKREEERQHARKLEALALFSKTINTATETGSRSFNA